MSWFISLILAGSMMVSGNNLPVSENNVYENQGVPVFSHSDETERFEQTYSFDPNGRIQVSNLNGSITIEAWDNPQIYLEAVKYADSKERLSEVSIKIDANKTNFKVETDYDEWNRKTNGIQRNKGGNYGSLRVEYRLKVPRTAMLDEIETVNGSVTVSNMTKYTQISTVNGRVMGTNLRGTAKLSTVNGSVLADFDRLENKSVVALETVNGSVKLVIPSDVNAVIKADTLNGSITNSFGLPVKKGEYVGRDLYGRIGSSSVSVEEYSKIKLSSVNGGLSIDRKNDGKNLNPATNLLPEKNSDDFDSEFDAEMRDAERETNREIREARRDVAKAQREMQRSMRVTQAETAKAMRDVSKEIVKIAPEVARVSAEALETAVIAIDSAEIKEKIEAAKLRQEAVLTRRVESQLNIPAVEQEKGSFAIEGVPTVVIEADNCVISVRGWDKPEVKYSMTKISKDQISNIQNKKSVQFKAEKTDKGEVAIEVINDSGSEVKFTEPVQVQLEVFVPKKSNLRIHTNDELRLEGVTGEINLEGGDASMNLRDIKGKLILRAGDGMVRLIGFSGELESEIIDGEMFLEGDFQRINSRADDGTITLTLPGNANATLITNGKIDFQDVVLRGVVKDDKMETKTLNIGEGGAKFKFDFADGKLVIREKKSISIS
jgi:DUF4097 and DUF4098 domain-containing protein YvlB